MEYTLDSVHLVKKALKHQFQDYRINSKEVILSGSEMKMQEKENRFFFGVLTCSDQRTADITYRGNTVLAVDSGSQIVQLFTSADFKDLQGVAATPEGLFLGHEINVQSL